MKQCKNCGKPLHDLFCYHCGQQAKVDRVTRSNACHKIFHFFTYDENGFLFTHFRKSSERGNATKNFLTPKRKSNPSLVSALLIWIAFNILFLYSAEIMFGENVLINYKNYFVPFGTTRFPISNLSFLLTIIIPFQVFYMFLLITKNSYYYF